MDVVVWMRAEHSSTRGNSLCSMYYNNICVLYCLHIMFLLLSRTKQQKKETGNNTRFISVVERIRSVAPRCYIYCFPERYIYHSLKLSVYFLALYIPSPSLFLSVCLSILFSTSPISWSLSFDPLYSLYILAHSIFSIQTTFLLFF